MSKASISLRSPGLIKEVLKDLSGGPNGSPDSTIEPLAKTKLELLFNDSHTSLSLEPYLGS